MRQAVLDVQSFPVEIATPLALIYFADINDFCFSRNGLFVLSGMA